MHSCLRMSGSRVFTNAATTTPMQPYRQLPDQGARVAQYRVYQILGKLLLALALLLSIAMVGGVVSKAGWLWMWLILLPIALLVALVWPGFPAFCRCPECKKRMTRSSKDGKIVRTGSCFNEIGSTRHYLVCHGCRLYLFLGESGQG